MSTLTEFEPFVDNTIHTFFRKLDEFAEKNEPCDIAKWLQYCEFLPCIYYITREYAPSC